MSIKVPEGHDVTQVKELFKGFIKEYAFDVHEVQLLLTHVEQFCVTKLHYVQVDTLFTYAV